MTLAEAAAFAIAFTPWWEANHLAFICRHGLHGRLKEQAAFWGEAHRVKSSVFPHHPYDEHE